MTLRVFRPGQLVFYPGFYQLKLESDQTPWREIDDPYEEVARGSTARPVVVTNVETGEETVYMTCVECAEAMDILTTTLNFRLQNGGGVRVYDGYRFAYYDELKKFKVQTLSA